MEVIQEKFDRFKLLCNDIDKENDWVIYFNKDVNLELFLFTIQSKLNADSSHSVDSIYNDILTTSKIDSFKISQSQQEKVRRYIEYFMAIAKSMTK